MHRGCFVWTPTPPLTGGRTPQPVLCVCACAGSSLLGWVGRFYAPHLSFGRFVLLLCSALFGLGLCLSFPFVCLLFFLCCFFLPLCACLLSLAFSGFRHRVSWSLALCGPSPPPPLFFSWFSPRAAWLGVFFLPPFSFLFPPPPLFLRLFVPPPPLVCFVGLPLLSPPCDHAAFVIWTGLWLIPCGCCPHTPPLVCIFRSCSRCRSMFPVFPLLCCSCLLAWRSSAVLTACCPPPPPPTGVPVVSCPVWCRRTVPSFRLVFCGAVLPGSVLRVVLWCLALLCCGPLHAVRCSLGRFFVCCAVLLVAAACCAVSQVVSLGCVVRVVVCFLVLVCVAVCCAVLCPWLRCCAALLRVVPPGVVLSCAEGAVTKRQRLGCLPTGKGKQAWLCVLCARCV